MQDIGPAIGVSMMFLVPIVIVLAVLAHRSRMATLKTLLELADRGAPVPHELLLGRLNPQRDEDLRRGMVLACVGLGALAFAFTLPNHSAWGLGLLPLFAGIGYLATWKLSQPGDSSGKDA